MEKIWKEGDIAFSLSLRQWVVLEKAEEIVPYTKNYPLKAEYNEIDFFFTEKGRRDLSDIYPDLMEYNPFDLSDTMNPEEYVRKKEPFVLQGKIVNIGDSLVVKYSQRSGTVISLEIDEQNRVKAKLEFPDDQDKIYRDFCDLEWPDYYKTIYR